MGNTLRHNASITDAQRARYEILEGRRARRRNVAEECELDARAFSVRIGVIHAH